MLTRNRITPHSLVETDQENVINVGKNYQAKLPEKVKDSPKVHYRSKARTYEVLLWKNDIIDVDEEDISDLLHKAKINHKFTDDMVLGLLVWHKGDIEAVEDDFENYEPKSDKWKSDDRIKFFLALDYHNKNFNVVKHLFPHKTVGNLVASYYLMKKNHTFLNEIHHTAAATAGVTITRKIKKIESMLPKHYQIKYGNMIRGLPQPKASACTNLAWTDHFLSQLVNNHVYKVMNYHNLHCSDSKFDHEFISDPMRPPRKNDRTHQCIYNHRKWLKEFYTTYNHDEFMKEISKIRMKPNVMSQYRQSTIISACNLVEELENRVLNRYDDNDAFMRKFKRKVPKLRKNWSLEDRKLMSMAIDNSDGNLYSIVDIMGNKTVGMIKNFIGLYSQRLEIDTEILNKLLSSE